MNGEKGIIQHLQVERFKVVDVLGHEVKQQDTDSDKQKVEYVKHRTHAISSASVSTFVNYEEILPARGAALQVVLDLTLARLTSFQVFVVHKFILKKFQRQNKLDFLEFTLQNQKSMLDH